MKKRMRKIDPLKPKEFARWGQEQFIAANVAIQKYTIFMFVYVIVFL